MTIPTVRPMRLVLVRGRALLAVVALTLAGLAACAPTPPVDRGPVPIPPTAPTLDVDVGTGIDSFTEVADGAAVTLTRGIQGGFHIWTAVRVHDATVTDVRMNLSARFEDGSPAGNSSSVAVPLERSGDFRTAAGQRIFIDDTSGLIGRRVVLRVEVVASDQRHGAGERTVTVGQ